MSKYVLKEGKMVKIEEKEITKLISIEDFKKEVSKERSVEDDCFKKAEDKAKKIEKAIKIDSFGFYKKNFNGLIEFFLVIDDRKEKKLKDQHWKDKFKSEVMDTMYLQEAWDFEDRKNMYLIKVGQY